MKTPHPHINPQENPTAALFRLLQLLPATPTSFTHNEAQLCEAICYQSRRAHQTIAAGLAAMCPLFPAPLEPLLPQHINLANIVIHLKHEADITHTLGEIYQSMAFDFYRQHPHLQQEIDLHPSLPHMPGPDIDPAAEQALKAEYDKHYYFPLGKLMQQLPGDITNQPHLTPEQSQMCQALGKFANDAFFTLSTGVESLGKLNQIARQFADHIPLPETRDLLNYLQAEAEFMQETRDDYRAAAQHVAQVV